MFYFWSEMKNIGCQISSHHYDSMIVFFLYCLKINNYIASVTETVISAMLEG